MLNQTRAHPGIARESKFQGPGINYRAEQVITCLRFVAEVTFGVTANHRLLPRRYAQAFCVTPRLPRRVRGGLPRYPTTPRNNAHSRLRIRRTTGWG